SCGRSRLVELRENQEARRTGRTRCAARASKLLPAFAAAGSGRPRSRAVGDGFLRRSPDGFGLGARRRRSFGRRNLLRRFAECVRRGLFQLGAKGIVCDLTGLVAPDQLSEPFRLCDERVARRLVSSTIAAFCWVTLSISLTAVLT